MEEAEFWDFGGREVDKMGGIPTLFVGFHFMYSCKLPYNLEFSNFRNTKDLKSIRCLAISYLS